LPRTPCPRIDAPSVRPGGIDFFMQQWLRTKFQSKNVMTRTKTLSRLISAALLLAPATGVAQSASSAAKTANDVAGTKPNVIVIFVDDMGYGDIGCFGSKKNRTPRLDKMAEEGARFTSFYVTSGVCSPSRSSQMTGCYPLRIGMHESSRGCFVLVPSDQRGLNPDETTVAEVLREQGYATACIGKWHLGDQPPFMPRKQGFDFYFGIPFSNDMGSLEKGVLKHGLPDLPLLRNEEIIDAPVDLKTITRRYTEEAVRFIRGNKDRPFFLYLPHTMVHIPLFSSERFAGKSANGPYGDAVEEVDWSTGQILDALKECGVDARTLVIFTSDNGGIRLGSNKPLAGGKATTLEGGQRVPCVMRWPGTVPAGSTCDEITSTLDILPTCARLSGGKLPGRTIDGLDITDLIVGAPGAKSPHAAFYYYFMSQLQAVRAGKWKLHVALDPKIAKWMGTPDGPVEARLYDLEADIGETTNVAGQHPEVVRRLNALAGIARKEIGDYQVEGAGRRAPGFYAKPKFIRVEE
jgi:arylsulfatase A-like enzyme